MLCCNCGGLGHLAPVYRCACSVCGAVCAVSCATWLLFTGVLASCVVLRARCPGPLDSCSPVCALAVLCCVRGVLGHLAPVHRCALSVRCVACAVSLATPLLFTGVCARCVVLRLPCGGRLGPCSLVCPPAVWCCVCGVLKYLTPVHRSARSERLVACAVSWDTWRLFTGVLARCVVLRVRCPTPFCSCSPMCLLGVWCCVRGVLGHLAPDQQCARSLRSLSSAVSCATWLLLTGVVDWCAVLGLRCPGPLCSGLPVCLLSAWCCVRGVLGHLLPVHRCACSLCCVACAVSLATWLLFIVVLSRCVVLRVRCPRPLGACSSMCALRALCCVCGVLGYLAPVHRCVRWLCCVVCAVWWPTWLLFTGVPARCVMLHMPCPWRLGPIFTGARARCIVLPARCPGPLGSCSSVCSLGLLCRVCSILGHLAPSQRCARSVRCVAYAVSLATWLLFTGVLARCVVLRWRCHRPPGSCPPVCSLGASCCLCGVLGHLAPVHWCARSERCVACVVSWATWFLFTGVLAQCIVLRARCRGQLSSCSPVCSLGALCCMCRVLGHLAPVHQCARPMCCVACPVWWSIWLQFTRVPARCVVLRVRCPGPLGSCSPVCLLGVFCCVRGVLGHFAPDQRCARSLRYVLCVVSCATLLLFTAVLAWCAVLRLRCPGPLGSGLPVCLLGVWCCVCGVLRHLAPVHRCACSVRGFACAVSLAT